MYRISNSLASFKKSTDSIYPIWWRNIYDMKKLFEKPNFWGSHFSKTSLTNSFILSNYFKLQYILFYIKWTWHISNNLPVIPCYKFFKEIKILKIKTNIFQNLRIFFWAVNLSSTSTNFPSTFKMDHQKNKKHMAK